MLTDQDRASRAFQQAFRNINFGRGPWSQSLTKAVAQIYFWSDLRDKRVVAMGSSGEAGIDAAAWGLAHRAEMAATPMLFKETGMEPFDVDKWVKIGVQLYRENHSADMSDAEIATIRKLINEMLSSPSLPRSLVTFRMEPTHAYDC